MCLFISIGAPILFSCTKKANETAAVSTPEGPSIARGKRIYQTTCTACHASDPRKAGTIGPDMQGSSLELIRSKVMTGRYPDNYPNPKRKTHSMGALPHLEPEIPSLHLYLNSGD